MMSTTDQTIELDARGLVCTCPRCGQRNRLLYDRLGHAFRCKTCQAEVSPPAEPIELQSAAQFDALTSHSAIPVLADFWAPWCGPCRMVAPELIKVAAAGAGRWLVVKVNTEDLPELARRFGIRGIPTLALFKGGRELARQAGAMPEPAILRFLQPAL